MKPIPPLFDSVGLQKDPVAIAALGISANVLVMGFPADKVTSLEEVYELARMNKLKDVAIYIHSGHNLVPSAGADQLANLLTGVNNLTATYCGVGSGTNTPASTDVDLQTSISPRQSISSRYLVTGGQAHFDTFFGSSNNNGTWNETGLFTAVTSGTLYARKLISPSFNKTTSVSAVVAWTITFVPV